MKYAEWQQSTVHRKWLRDQMQTQFFQDFLSTLDSLSYTKNSVDAPSVANGDRAFGMTVGYQHCLNNIDLLVIEPQTSTKIKESYGGGKEQL